MNEAIFKNTVLAILKAQPGLGSVQLRKALIIADATYYALFGKSLTGAKYIKHHYGPVPDFDAFSLLNKMYYKENIIDIFEEAEGTVTKNSYFARKEPDPGAFTEEEDRIIRFAAAVALKYSASKLSDMTHDETFNNTPMHGEIPLDRVCTITITDRLDTPDFTNEEKLELTEVLKSDEVAQYTFV
jgi:hypothetical protein